MWDFRAYRGMQGRSGCGNLAENAADFSFFRSSMSMNFRVQARASACLEPRRAVRLGGVGDIVSLLLVFYGLLGLYVLLYALLILLVQKCYYYK